MAKNSWQQDRARRAVEAERFAAQQRREEQRQQREAERAAAKAERDARAQYLSDRQQEAEARTRDAARRTERLANVLQSALGTDPPLSFETMRSRFVPTQPPQPPSPEPEPTWQQFAPREPGFFAKLFRGKTRQFEDEQQARLRFEQAAGEYQRRQQARADDVQKAKEKHARKEDERRVRTDKRNAGVAELERAFNEYKAEAVERYLKLVLQSRKYPGGVTADAEAGFRKDSGQVLVIRELPDTDVLPTEASFRYVKSRDTIESTQRKPAELRESYRQLIAQLALITLRDTFNVTSEHHVNEVTVNCHLSTTDRATGQDSHPCLLTVSASRSDFDKLVLSRLEPTECLRHLNALMSPHPYDVEGITPIFDYDLDRFRLSDAEAAATGLDSRTVLIELKPVEFEHLVRELFEAMGMESWVTQLSRDDGVDGVAVNPDPIMGGLAIIQAKRYVNVVPTEAVRALSGVMDDKKAGTGILVTTSYFGKATHEFAKRNERIRLIEGPQLKQLISDHLGKEVILGSKQPSKKR